MREGGCVRSEQRGWGDGDDYLDVFLDDRGEHGVSLDYDATLWGVRWKLNKCNRIDKMSNERNIKITPDDVGVRIVIEEDSS